MLVYVSGGTTYSPQIPLDAAISDWTDVCIPVEVPSDAASAAITLGLEAVSGTVNFDNLRVEVNPDLHYDRFNDGVTAIGGRWTSGTKTIVAHGAGSALQMINAAGTAKNMTCTTLPVDALRGRRVVLRAQVNTAGIPAKPNSWNGSKAMLTYKRSDNSLSYPQIGLETGPYAWADVSRVIELPDDVIGAWLDIGLE